MCQVVAVWVVLHTAPHPANPYTVLYTAVHSTPDLVQLGDFALPAALCVIVRPGAVVSDTSGRCIVLYCVTRGRFVVLYSTV